MKTLSEYRELIIGWAADRNLIEGSTPSKQLDKLFEELGEYAGNSARGRDRKDDLGDIFVVLTILSAQLKLNLNMDLPEPTEVAIENYTNGLVYSSVGMVAVTYEMLRGGIPEMTLKEVGHTILQAVYILNIAAKVNSVNLTDCVEISWNEIKDRKGKMVNGVFVKEADLV